MSSQPKSLLIILSIVLPLVITLSGYGQDREVIAKKITAKVCQCIGKVEKYEDLKHRLEHCNDTVMQQVVNNPSADESRIINNPVEYRQLQERVSVLILTDCQHVRQLIEAEAKDQPVEHPYPVNFGPDDLKEAYSHPGKWNGKVVAFEGEIIEVHMPGAHKPYMKVKLSDGQTLWVGSMVNSKYDKPGHSLRFIGYFVLTTAEDFSHKYHNGSFHVLAFGELDLKTNQMAFMPDAESQIKEWSQGIIPQPK